VTEFETQVGKIVQAREAAAEMLRVVQLQQWPDSHFLTLYEVLTAWDAPHAARNLTHCLQYPVGVFYECGKLPDGTYSWRGFRYGLEDFEYLSGFGRF